MKANTVIKHVPNQGVSLSKVGDPVTRPALPVRLVIRPCASMSGADVWSRVYATPRADIGAWITACLAEGDYADASELSSRLHAPAPQLPEGVIIFRTR